MDIDVTVQAPGVVVTGTGYSGSNGATVNSSARDLVTELITNGQPVVIVNGSFTITIALPSGSFEVHTTSSNAKIDHTTTVTVP